VNVATETYRINEAETAVETIDGEVVIVQFTTGNYYALSGSAAGIWHALVAGHGVDAIVEHVEVDPAVSAADSIREFVGQLVQERLLLPSEGSESPERGISSVSPDQTFEPPLLEKYEDMQQLILLDPVHEVDGAGWPHGG